ncbi:MAG: hypothetical protein RL095_2109 [Verrucomicrobiota bacterium]|jgi:SulP family sulfate permease
MREEKTWVDDVWGGFAAMLVALPASIAYGVAVYALMGSEYIAAGVRAGILGALCIGLVAPFLGGAPRLISAPCAPAAAVLAALVAECLSGAHRGAGALPPEKIVVILTLVALFSALLQLLYGFLGGGRLIKYIPYPVVSGYLSGVGALIILSQVPKLLGAPKDLKLGAALLQPGSWQGPALLVSLVTILGVLFGPRLTRKMPATILGLAAGMLAYFVLSFWAPELRRMNPLVIGKIDLSLGCLLPDIPGLWQQLRGLSLHDWQDLVMPALMLSVLLSIDTLKTCVVVDALTRSRHDSNRELIGQGAGNLCSAILGGMPGAGTMGATMVNLNSGGHTRRSGVCEGFFVLAALLLCPSLLAWLPLAALAGILVVGACRMIDWKSFLLLRQRGTILDFCVIAAVIAVAVGWNLIAAAGAGLALAILLFIREQIRGSVIRRKLTGRQFSSKQQRLPAEQAILEAHGNQVRILELQGSLFFGTTDQLRSEVADDLRECRYLILDLRRVQSVDYTAAHLMEQLEGQLKERSGWLIFSRLPESLPNGRDLRAYFDQIGVLDSSRHVLRFDSLDDSMRWVEDRILESEACFLTGREPPLDLAEAELFRELDPEHLAALAACAQEREFAGGENIFAAGNQGDELYIVRSGVVRIVLPLEKGHHNLASFGRGSFFGEMAFLDRGAARSADAVAALPCSLWVISRARFDEVSRLHPAVGVRVFARLARTISLRLRRADQELRALYES